VDVFRVPPFRRNPTARSVVLQGKASWGGGGGEGGGPRKRKKKLGGEEVPGEAEGKVVVG